MNTMPLRNYQDVKRGEWPQYNEVVRLDNGMYRAWVQSSSGMTVEKSSFPDLSSACRWAKRHAMQMTTREFWEPNTYDARTGGKL